MKNYINNTIENNNNDKSTQQQLTEDRRHKREDGGDEILALRLSAEIHLARHSASLSEAECMGCE